MREQELFAAVVLVEHIGSQASADYCPAPASPSWCLARHKGLSGLRSESESSSVAAMADQQAECRHQSCGEQAPAWLLGCLCGL